MATNTQICSTKPNRPPRQAGEDAGSSAGAAAAAPRSGLFLSGILPGGPYGTRHHAPDQARRIASGAAVPERVSTRRVVRSAMTSQCAPETHSRNG